jgi:5S rRNA maturation endonuclease (ribonuclease M5)
MVEIPKKYKGKSLKASWIYRAMDGTPFGVVGRYQNGNGKKDIVPFFELKDGTCEAGIELNPRPLFGLDKLAHQAKNKAVFIVEGEKAAAAMQSIGLCAVTSLGGSQAATKTDWTPLNGYTKVCILPDNDEPGEHYIKDVYASLMALRQSPVVKVLRLPDLPKAGDVVDWLQNHAPEWDGLQPFPDTEKKWVLSELRAELKKAVPIPEEWNLAILAGSAPSDFEWKKPNEIQTKTPAVEVLQSELIPKPFRLWLADVAYRMQTPADFSTVSALVIVGSVIGAGCSIRPKRLDDWEVIPNVWGACIGRPSVVLKSPSMKEPMQQLERLQAFYGERFEQEKAEAEFDALANKVMLDDVKDQLSSKAKGKGKDRVVSPDDFAKLKADYVELTQNKEPEPVRRLFKTNETSIQSMTLIQSQNPRGLLVFRDELTALLVKWDREDGADERAYFLEGWNGNGSYTDCKIGRGITDAKQICISLLGGIQPDKLKRYLYQAMQGNNDGLMQRLQLAVWPDEPKSWQLIDTRPNQADKKRAYDILQALAETDFTRYGATKTEYDDRPYFRFDKAGQAVFNHWLTELHTVKLQREENPLMAEHLGKFRSLMPSLALIFHCIDLADGKSPGPVSEQAARLAVEWCKYLESHARRIYAMAESPEHEAAVRLAGKIKAKALSNPFTCKEVYDKGWHGLKDRHEVEAACNILIDENWLMMERKPVSGSRGRPPLPDYYINPVFL